MKLTQMLFEWVLTAAFLILAVLALRALLGRRVSASLRYALWAAVLVRLLVPVQLFTTPVAGTSVLRETGVEQWVAPPDLRPGPVEAASAAPAPVPPPTELPDGTVIVYQPVQAPATVRIQPIPVLQILGWLWLAGSAGMGLAFVLSNLTFARRLRRARTPLEGADCPLPVYTADGLPSPCLFGLFRPAVYITEDAAQDPAMLRHILAHEYTHFRHGDHIWNGLRSAALILHWWNPLVWLAAVLSRRDGELACDEGALKRLGEAERIAYGRTLVALITVQPRPGDLFRCATTMTGGQKSVFDRVARIAKAPKRWLWAAVAAVIATALACVCAFGRAEETPDPASGVTADLTFSLETSSDGKPYVRMDGTADGEELPRGAFWYPEPSAFEEFSGGYLSMVYPGFTDGMEGHVTAGWTDESHTSVTASTRMTAMLSSQFNVGWWEFTVNLDSGTVTSMEGLSFREGLPEGETRFYPQSISDEEALKAARVAAKLLTAGEDYYNNHNGGAEIPQLYADVLEGGEFYSVSLEEWTRTTLDKFLREEKEAGYMAPGFEVSGYTLVDLDGDGQDELILRIGQEGVGETYLIFHQLDGRLGGYLGVYKSMQSLKADGTFFDQYLFSEEWDRQGLGYSRVSFTKTGLEFHPFTYELFLPGDLSEDEKYVYVVDGKTVDVETYSAAVEEQDAKPNVVWREFDPPSADRYTALPELYAKVLRGESKFVLYKNEPPIFIGEVPALIDPYDGYMCIQRYAVVDLLGGLGSNEMPQALVYLCGVSGDMAGYLLLWDEDGQVHGEIFDSYGWRNRWFSDLKADGTFVCTDSLGSNDWMSISRLVPTAAGSWSLYSEAVRRNPDALGEKIDLESFMVIDRELDEAEFEQALEAHRAKPDATWYALPLKDPDAAPSQPSPQPLNPSYTLDEYGVNLYITGLDCESAHWYSKANCSTPISETALGELSVSKPRFLGGEFSNTYRAVDAQYSPEGGGRLWMTVSEDISGDVGSREFLVDLTTGAVTEQENDHPVWRGKLPVPPDKVLAEAALTLAQLIRSGSDFYQSSLPAPEEGPLPFDVPMKLMFASGAGAWDTLLTLHPDGTFEGNYHDTDAGDSGDGYQSTEYVCKFHGRFGDIKQVTDASWSLTLAELVIDTGHPIGEEWIETIRTGDGSYNQRYISSDPYGFNTPESGEPLEPGAPFMLYTPEARGYRPTDELYEMRESENYDSVMFQFWSWWPGRHAWAPDGTLGCYGLCSMETGRGFFDLYTWGIA